MGRRRCRAEEAEPTVRPSFLSFESTDTASLSLPLASSLALGRTTRLEDVVRARHIAAHASARRRTLAGSPRPSKNGRLIPASTHVHRAPPVALELRHARPHEGPHAVSLPVRSTFRSPRRAPVYMHARRCTPARCPLAHHPVPPNPTSTGAHGAAATCAPTRTAAGPRSVVARWALEGGRTPSPRPPLHRRTRRSNDVPPAARPHTAAPRTPTQRRPRCRVKARFSYRRYEVERYTVRASE